jgi:putative FmdB family regulatory protein
MLYDYKCKKCDKTWEESHPVDNRDVPCGKPCPCGSNGTIVRLMSAPGLNFEGSVGKISKTGNFK